jgi:hypothetical protein
MFSVGFEKCAAGELMPQLAMAGAILGMGIGGLSADKKNRAFVEQELLNGKKQDARKVFGVLKKHLPEDTILYTTSDLHKKVHDAKTMDDMNFWQMLRSLGEGNAAAIPKKETKNNKQIPKELRNKNIIVSADKINPLIMAHEAGHVIDFNDIETGKEKLPFFTHPDRYEHAAWDKAPDVKASKKDYERVRTGAVGTYQRARNYPLAGLAIGGLGGLGVGYGLDKLLARKTPSKVYPPDILRRLAREVVT